MFCAKLDYIYCMDNDNPKRSLLFYISPCAIAAVIVLIGIIDSYRQLDASQGWSGIGLIIGIPALLMLTVVDVVVKFAITRRALIVWLIEVIVLLAGIIYMAYFSSFGF